jgi:hypothetical protein
VEQPTVSGCGAHSNRQGGDLGESHVLWLPGGS